MKTREYKCCVCSAVFSGNRYNWYAYCHEKKFHICPMCDSRLVQTYDFEYVGLLDKITVRLFILSAIAWMIANFVWGQTIGVIVFVVPAVIGGVTHAMYWSVIANVEEKEIQETRVLENV